MASAALFGAFARLLLALAAAQVPPLALSLTDADAESTRGFAFGIGCGVFFGVVFLLLGRGGRRRLERREALFFAVAGWGVAGVFAAIPFTLSGVVSGFAGGFVEAVSGVTATGLGVIDSLDTVPRALILWRALLQWIGGYATLIFVAALAPWIAPAAVPDSSRPRLRRIAATTALVYGVLTALVTAALAFSGASLFEAGCYAMSSLSTGGFSTSDGGPMALGRSGQAILMLAMVAGAVNLLGTWRAGVARSGRRRSNRHAELVFFLAAAIVGAGSVAVALGIAGGYPPGDAAWRGLFAVLSALTTTGFVAGFDVPAPVFVVLALAGLALVGGASGSTAGGVKLMRALLLLRRSRHELERLAHPHRVIPIRVGGISVTETAMQGIWAFFVSFILFLIILTVTLAAHGLDFASASILALSALTNTGPLLAEAVGAEPGLAALSWSGDIILAVGMLVGRLEVFTFFVVLTPFFWRR